MQGAVFLHLDVQYEIVEDEEGKVRVYEQKYHARERKGKMTASEFSEWVLMAEQLRDEMLCAYAKDGTLDLAEYRERLNAV